MKLLNPDSDLSAIINTLLWSIIYAQFTLLLTVRHVGTLPATGQYGPYGPQFDNRYHDGPYPGPDYDNFYPGYGTSYPGQSQGYGNPDYDSLPMGNIPGPGKGFTPPPVPSGYGEKFGGIPMKGRYPDAITYNGGETGKFTPKLDEEQKYLDKIGMGWILDAKTHSISLDGGGELWRTHPLNPYADVLNSKWLVNPFLASFRRKYGRKL